MKPLSSNRLAAVGASLENYRDKSKALAPVSEAAQALRERVNEFDASAVEVAENQHLSPDGVASQVGDKAEKLNASVEGDPKVRRARDAIKARRESIHEQLRPKSANGDDGPDPQIASEIRQQVGSAKRPYEAARAYVDDPASLSAILDAPPALVGLTADQKERLRTEMVYRQHPEAKEELDALDSAERLLDGAVASVRQLANDRAEQARMHAQRRAQQRYRAARATGRPFAGQRPS